MNNIPLALYVHLPWCIRKCPYCDFNSHEIKDGSFPEREYVDAVVRDLNFSAGLFRGRKLESVFLGGGTPSLMSASGIVAILEAIDDVSGLCAGTEITLEANPGVADSRRFAGYRSLGVNRLSIGAQSFDNHKLAAIGRIHDAGEARAAVAAAAGAGFSNINIDLMYGLPGQTPQEALSDITAAVSLEPEHISWYQLTLEPNTLFHAKPPPLPGDDFIWDMQTRGEDYLASQGYRQYEVSAWSRPGSECRHNLNYWEFGDYLGVGAGAHGKISNGSITRQSRLRVPQGYMRAAGSDAAIAAQRTGPHPGIHAQCATPEKRRAIILFQRQDRPGAGARAGASRRRQGRRPAGRRTGAAQGDAKRRPLPQRLVTILHALINHSYPAKCRGQSKNP